MERTSSIQNRSSLSTPSQYLKGVGPDRAQLLERLELRTAQDILFFFPRSYKEFEETVEVNQLAEGMRASIRGIVEEYEQRVTESGKTILGVLIRQGNQYLRATWFNQPFMLERFRHGLEVILSGEVRLQGMRWEMVHPRVQFVDDPPHQQSGNILPVYRLTEGLKQQQIQRIVGTIVEAFAAQVPEVFPREFLEAKGLLGIELALREIHRPSSIELRDRAQYRFIYQELLTMQLAIGLRRRQVESLRTAIAMPTTAQIDTRIRRLLTHALTEDQDRSILEITTDMARAIPMNRLLHGDVGTGKTLVAAYAMLVTVANRRQAVLMAPTEVLARQHESTLREILAESKVRIGLLTGSTSVKDRAQLMEDMASGSVDIIVATQAVLHQDNRFAKLGLAVIDEQHKFGVQQRAVLRQGATDPHCLIMTATPIPRTVSMTLYGDLDVSHLRQGPPGRQPVRTYWANESQRDQWWEFFRRKLTEGRQGYVISPLVNEATDEVMGAEQLLENLANGELANFRLDLLHGRMSGRDKELSLSAFRAGTTQVLVATSAVEVGIDVRNAVVMTIENADRFGLSQLHQLRGRVGRGTHAGYLCLFADSKSEATTNRLNALVQTTDGFELAEIDFRLRGPGELFGTRQHGSSPLMVADLQRDQAIVERSRADARELMAQDPELSSNAFALLRRRVLARYGNDMSLGDVG